MTYAYAARTFVELMDEFAWQNMKSAWVEKTPSHVHHLGEIEKYVPDAKIVHIVRDGLFVVASLRAAAAKYPNAHWARRYDSLDRCIDRWNECQRCTLAFCEHKNNVIVSYELLAGSPISVVRNLCTRVGLEFAPDMVLSRTAAVNNVRSDKEPWKKSVELGIDLNRQTVPHDILSPEEIDYVRERLLPIDALGPLFLK